MKIKLISVAKFHHFHLATQLHKFKILDKIYSGYPRYKLLNAQNIPKSKIKTYPYYLLVYLFLIKFFLKPSNQIASYFQYLSHKKLSKKVAGNLTNVNVLIASAGSGLEAGKKIKKLGGKFICDRGSTHIMHQYEILKKEYEIYKIPFDNVVSAHIINREIEEYNIADIISVPSTYVLNSFLNNGINRKKLFLNPYGVDLKKFYSIKKNKSKTFRVIFVGQLSIRKGIFYLLEAFNKLKNENKELILIGSIQNEIKEKVQRYIGNKIKYLSIIKNDDLVKYYSNSDVFVLPSIEDGFALVIAEALACGCPVIATENSGASDLFLNGKEGFIIKARSVDCILEKLELLSADKTMQEEMSFNAIKLSKSIGGWDDYGKRWYTKLKSLETNLKN